MDFVEYMEYVVRHRITDAKNIGFALGEPQQRHRPHPIDPQNHVVLTMYLVANRDLEKHIAY